MRPAKVNSLMIVGLVMVALCDLTAWGVTIRADVPDSSYLDLAASPEYAAVGVFANSWGYTGCGILVAPDWVLTAAHLFVAASSGTFTINGTSYASTELIKNPGWDGNASDGADFGLVHLNQSVLDTPPAFLYTGSSELGKTGTFVGFGQTGTGLTGATTLDYKKRAFQNVIDDVPHNSPILLASDFDNPNSAADNYSGDAVPLPLEGCVAPGDSGGGVFITEGSQTYLAGVVSYVAAVDGSANSDYGDISGFGRVSPFVPWITSTVPEPSSAAMLMVGGLGILFCRRFWRSRTP